MSQFQIEVDDLPVDVSKTDYHKFQSGGESKAEVEERIRQRRRDKYVADAPDDEVPPSYDELFGDDDG